MKIEKIAVKVDELVIEGQGSYECMHDCTEYSFTGNSNEYTRGCYKAPYSTAYLSTWL
ncbi:MAG: hypothetical protein ACM3X7_06625 [Solirubrobacterales bacterium]